MPVRTRRTGDLVNERKPYFIKRADQLGVFRVTLFLASLTRQGKNPSKGSFRGDKQI
jgi:hypothetical protein